MYVCKVIGKIISTVKNEKLVGHSIVLVQAAALNDRGSLEADGPVFAAADTIGCGEGNFVLVTRGSNARYACKWWTWPWWAFWTAVSGASPDPMQES